MLRLVHRLVREVEKLHCGFNLIFVQANEAALLSLIGESRGLLLTPYLRQSPLRGTDVVVFQLRPLRLLGVIPHKDSSLTTGLAVDHRHIKAVVSVYRQGRFEHQEFSVPPS